MWIALVSVALTLFVVWLVLTLNVGETRIDQRVQREYEAADPQFRRALGSLLGPPIVAGNRVDVLKNGEQIFPAMLAAIRAARRTITFETFIYWSGSIGQEFADALSERSKAGVRVHVLLDWFGSARMDDSLIETMRSAGVEIKRYHKPHWSRLPKLNNRTHRKLLVVDGTIGFTGGVGIADQWRGAARDEDHWRDNHYRIEGPVVAHLQGVFMSNWIKATGAVLHGEHYFPALEPRGDLPAQMFSSSPSGGADSMHLMYLMTVTAAASSIDLSTPYFVPDDLATKALVEAARRGVRVRVIVPSQRTDSPVVRRASRARWGPLLAAGIEIHEFQPTMLHNKMLVVDRLLASIGSTNFDNRSFALNDEANLNVLDTGLAGQLAAIFEDDLQRAERVTLEAWQNRPWREKMIERAASLLGAQL
ncbi:MAG: cardiolipin synthase [Candidatus Methylophosphatis roskildensis]